MLGISLSELCNMMYVRLFAFMRQSTNAVSSSVGVHVLSDSCDDNVDAVHILKGSDSFTLVLSSPTLLLSSSLANSRPYFDVK